ncbi:hypothetical protein DFH08DRAFT_824075 [Mycena albidolilacea]|uniref:Uncharacterized protein n=1 Tax=Mycena albidolilacea TaxID=1033008 RepID=A0AAD6Z542_9AGAR|nr:hypothetical protein DFH08DRAFT_824075 [Mycena albidolilacea]
MVIIGDNVHPSTTKTTLDLSPCLWLTTVVAGSDYFSVTVAQHGLNIKCGVKGSNAICTGTDNGVARVTAQGLQMEACIGQRDFAAAVLLPYAAALQRQSVVVVLAAHAELLGITRQSAAVWRHPNTCKYWAAAVGNTLQRQSWHFAAAVGVFSVALGRILRHFCSLALFLARTLQKYSPTVTRGLAASFAHLANVLLNPCRVFTDYPYPPIPWEDLGRNSSAYYATVKFSLPLALALPQTLNTLYTTIGQSICRGDSGQSIRSTARESNQSKLFERSSNGRQVRRFDCPLLLIPCAKAEKGDENERSIPLHNIVNNPPNLPSTDNEKEETAAWAKQSSEKRPKNNKNSCRKSNEGTSSKTEASSTAPRRSSRKAPVEVSALVTRKKARGRRCHLQFVKPQAQGYVCSDEEADAFDDDAKSLRNLTSSVSSLIFKHLSRGDTHFLVTFIPLKPFIQPLGFTLLKPKIHDLFAV